MNKSKQYKRNEWIMIFVFLLMVVGGMVQTASAFDADGTCYNSLDCTNAINGGTFTVIKLGADITGIAATFLNNPTGMSNKIFDGMQHKLVGTQTNVVWGISTTGKNNYTIRNITILNFGGAGAGAAAIIQGGDYVNYTNITTDSGLYFCGTHNFSIVQNSNFSGVSRYGYALFDSENGCTRGKANGSIYMNNTFMNSSTGMYLDGTNANPNVNYTIKDSVFNVTSFGLKLNTTYNATISNITLKNLSVQDATGIYIEKLSINPIVSNIKGVESIYPTSGFSPVFIRTYADNSTIDSVNISEPYGIGLQVLGNDSVVSNLTILGIDGVSSHGAIYLIGKNGTLKDSTLMNIDWNTNQPGDNWTVVNNTINFTDLKSGRNNTIIRNIIRNMSADFDGVSAIQNVTGNNISQNQFIDRGAIYVLGKYAFKDNIIADNVFNTANSWAIKLINASNNTLKNNTIISTSGYNYVFSTNTSNNTILNPPSSFSVSLTEATSHAKVQSPYFFFTDTSSDVMNISTTNSSLNINGVRNIGVTVTNSVIVPTSDILNVSVSAWKTSGDYHKTLTINSSIHNNPTTFVIGDFLANSNIQVNKNGVLYNTYLSNSSGYITFAHSSYSDVIIETFLSLPAIEVATCPNVNSDINAAFGLIGVLLIVFAAGMLISGIRSMNYPFMIVGIVAAITGAIMIIVGYFITITISNGVGCLG